MLRPKALNNTEILLFLVIFFHSYKFVTKKENLLIFKVESKYLNDHSCSW